jgi:formylglycine-generating enzyme required for sulfatase activity
MNALEKDQGWIYCLPTEQEWEYACRGGPMMDRFEGAFLYYFAEPTNGSPDGKASFRGYGELVRKVGSYPPNRLGLHDMHGNVREWCDPLFPNNIRCMRGGNFDDTPDRLGASAWVREKTTEKFCYEGFRVARVPVGSR